MKDIDLKQWASAINIHEESIIPPILIEHQEDSPNKKSAKPEDLQNLNMPKKTSYVRTSKYQQLEKIDEI